MPYTVEYPVVLSLTPLTANMKYEISIQVFGATKESKTYVSERTKFFILEKPDFVEFGTSTILYKVRAV